MKLKYYLSPALVKLVIISFIIALFLLPAVQGYTLDSSSVNPTGIFKCQPAVITANVTGTVTNIDVMINNTVKVMIRGTLIDSKEKYTMTDLGAGHWRYAYGNDPAIIWGNKTIEFEVTEGGLKYVNDTGLHVLVYSDECTGVDIQGYQNISTGLGNYTSKFFTGEADIVAFALNPWIEYWGYVFYIIVVFWIALIVYMKNQLIIQPILIIFICLGALASTTWLPPEIKNYVIMILGLGLGGMFYKVFKT